MTSGEKFIAGLQLKTVFRDRYERRAYVRSVAIARHVVDDPTLIGNAKRFLEEHVKDDPHQAPLYALWTSMLEKDAETIARALLEDSDAGAELRSTAPVFVVIQRDELHLA